MKYLITLVSIVLFVTTNAQTTVIPDVNFEQALINLGLDTGIPDGSIPTVNIDTVTNLYIDAKGINDLTGIEDFVSLINLHCSNNQLTNLDLNLNTLLDYLDCSWNYLSNIDVTQNTALTTLYCYVNQLTELNVTQNSTLKKLWCTSNQLSSLNVTQNTVLTYLWCQNNQLNCLNLKNGNNNNFTFFIAVNNPNLTCIDVDNIAYSTSNWIGSNFDIDATMSYSTNCGDPCAVGIDDLDGNFSNLNFYPNPTTGNLSIDLGELKNNIIATLTNNLGQIISTENFGATNVINLNINAPTGIYYLQLETTNGETKTIKVLKE